MTLPRDPWELAREACTEKQFQVFELRERHGMSIYGIALALDIDPSTVRGHLRAATRKVQHAERSLTEGERGMLKARRLLEDG